MHKLFRSIGLMNIENTKNYGDYILKIALNEEIVYNVAINPYVNFIQKNRLLLDQIGISVIYRQEHNELITIDSAFPFLIGSSQLVAPIFYLEETISEESYHCIVENRFLYSPLVFSIINTLEIMTFPEIELAEQSIHSFNISGLSSSGKIILGTNTSYEFYKEYVDKASTPIAELKIATDEDELHTYNQSFDALNRLCHNEDVLSIVDSSIIPFGYQSCVYSIIGHIVDIKYLTNPLSNQRMYLLIVKCLDFYIDILINQEDLEGEPQCGRRFSGIVYLQAYINLDD